MSNFIDAEEEEDRNRELCANCWFGGSLILCDKCPNSYHKKCISDSTLDDIDNGTRKRLKTDVEVNQFICPQCTNASLFSIHDQNLTAKDAFSFLDEIVFDNIPKDAFRNNVKSSATIGSLLKYLEWLLSNKQIEGVAKLVSTYFQIDRGSTSEFIKKFKDGEASLSFQILLLDLAKIIGNDLLQTAYDDLSIMSNEFVAVGLGPSITNNLRPCLTCGVLRHLHRFCFFCGTVFDVKKEVLGTIDILHTATNRKIIKNENDDDNINNIKEKKDSTAKKSSTVSNNILKMITKVIDKQTADNEGNNDVSVTRHLASLRGLRYYYTTTLIEKDFLDNGGDQLFLARNLATCAIPGIFRDIAMILFREITRQWMNIFEWPGDISISSISTAVEGLHCLVQLLRDDAVSKAYNDQSYTYLKDLGIPFKFRNDTSDQAELADDEIEDYIVPINEIDSFIKSIRETVQRTLRSFDPTEFMGFDCQKKVIPTAKHTHCGHCGNEENSKKDKRCKDCKAILKEHIDYGALLDAFIWCYVFYDTNVGLNCYGGYNIHPWSIFRFLPVARSYQRPDELGHSFFKLQVFFLTHFVYVLSDWGHHGLRRQLFAEEFEFIVKYLRFAIALEDTEVLGELLQCLKILGYSEKRDPELVHLVNDAYVKLISLEKKTEGLWLGGGTYGHAYKCYHGTYCAILGLVDYNFPDDDDSAPLPNFHKILKNVGLRSIRN